MASQRGCSQSIIGLQRVIWLTLRVEGILRSITPRKSHRERFALWHNSCIVPTTMKPTPVSSTRFVNALLATFVCAVAPVLAASPSPVFSAPASAGQPDSTEMEQTLYVQAPDFAGGANSIVLVWLPEPLESTCLGRTMKECFNIDFCIRTTNPNGPQCRDLGIPRAQLPHYPPDMRPRRAISVVLRAMGNDHGFDRLKAFYRNASPSSLSRLSPRATIQARIRYDDNPSFQGFNLVEVLSTP